MTGTAGFPICHARSGKQPRVTFGALQSFQRLPWECLILSSVGSPLAACVGTFSPNSSSKNISISFFSDHFASYQEDFLGNFPFKIKPIFLLLSEPPSCPKDGGSTFVPPDQSGDAQFSTLPSTRCFHQPLLGVSQEPVKSQSTLSLIDK